MLKQDAYLTVNDMAGWLRIPPSKMGEPSVKAVLQVQDLFYKAIEGGLPGNEIEIEYLPSATAGAEVVTVLDRFISVTIEDGVTTAAQVKSAVEASPEASALVRVSVASGGALVDVQSAFPATNLAGGTYSSGYDPTVTAVIETAINAACDKVKGIISGPVLTKEFTEFHDGSNSNVIKPHHWPVTAITEVKVDYNRKFDAAEPVAKENYFIRGGADVRQVAGDVELRVIGNDLVLRDDNERFILGSIFLGSALGAIRLKYKAGWGETPLDLPGDLVLATKLLAQFFYNQHDNNDLGVKTKSIKDQSYTSFVDGIPKQIYEMIEQYIDMSLGTRPVPQRNEFGI